MVTRCAEGPGAAVVGRGLGLEGGGVVQAVEGPEFEASNTRLEHENMSTMRGVQGQR